MSAVKEQGSKDRFNYGALSAAVRIYRRERGLTLRAAYAECGVSETTISRIENDTGKPDAIVIARLCAWMDTPVSRFAGEVVSFAEETTPAKIDSLLFNDPTLTRDAAAEISKMFRAAYRALASGSRKGVEG